MLGGFELYPRWVPLSPRSLKKPGKKRKEMIIKKINPRHEQSTLDASTKSRTLR